MPAPLTMAQRLTNLESSQAVTATSSATTNRASNEMFLTIAQQLLKEAPQSQAAYSRAMGAPMTVTLTRAEWEMVVGAMQTKESVYWNGGKPFPGHAMAYAINNQFAQQVPWCVGGTATPTD